MLVATDRSDTATRAVAWAAEMSGKYGAGPGERDPAGGAGPAEGELLGRAAHVARVFARFGLGDLVSRGRDEGPGGPGGSAPRWRNSGPPSPSSARSCPPGRICCRPRW